MSDPSFNRISDIFKILDLSPLQNFVLPQYDNDNLTEEHEEEEKVELKGEQLQEGCIGNDSMEIEELINTNVDMLESGIEGENQQDVLQVQVGRSVADEVEENVVVNNGIGERLRKKLDQKTIEEEDAEKVDDSNRTSTDTFSNPHFKQGRRCGLCGGATDGKPPKKLVQDIGESEIDTYSGSSASEEPNYDVWDGFGDEPGWLGRLLGPINDRYGIAGIWVHQHCAVWSPEVHISTHFYFLFLFIYFRACLVEWISKYIFTSYLGSPISTILGCGWQQN